jgi:hypothetical protein
MLIISIVEHMTEMSSANFMEFQHVMPQDFRLKIRYTVSTPFLLSLYENFYNSMQIVCSRHRFDLDIYIDSCRHFE